MIQLLAELLAVSEAEGGPRKSRDRREGEGLMKRVREEGNTVLQAQPVGIFEFIKSS